MCTSSVTDLIARRGGRALLALAVMLVAMALAYGISSTGGDAAPAPAEAQAGDERTAQGTPAPPRGVHRRAWLLEPALLRARPGGRPVARLGRRTDFGSPTVLAVVSARGPWLGVLSEQRPNGRVGWIHERRVRAGFVAVELRASLRRRELAVLHRGRTVRRMRVAIGGPETPTPRGLFAVTDRVEIRGASRAAYGCCAIALSGTQPDLPPGWRGGDRLAIHSTNATSSIGSPASFGCLRASERDMRWLMRRVPLGTPVRIEGLG